MFKFEREQRIFEIGGIKIGGQPGEMPTVMIGSIFHRGHRIVQDSKSGAFNREEAERLVTVQDEMSNITGLPCMVDVVGETVEALNKHVDFVSEVTEVPILMNGPSVSVRVEALKYAAEIGLIDRVVYNSVNYTLNDEEIASIRSSGATAALVQAFNPRNPRPNGMIEILKSGWEGGKGLLAAASTSGVEKQLILAPVLDVPSIGFAAQGVFLAKREFGLPVGTAPIGVIGGWERLRDLGRYAKKTCRAGAAALAQSMGADFILYGSLAKARDLFPVCAMIDATIAYNARTLGLKQLTRNHPLHRIF